MFLSFEVFVFTTSKIILSFYHTRVFHSPQKIHKKTSMVYCNYAYTKNIIFLQTLFLKTHFLLNCNNFCSFVAANLALRWGLPLHSNRWSCLAARTEKKLEKKKIIIEHFRPSYSVSFSCIKLAKLSIKCDLSFSLAKTSRENIVTSVSLIFPESKFIFFYSAGMQLCFWKYLIKV